MENVKDFSIGSVVSERPSEYARPLDERILDFVVSTITFLKRIKYSPINNVFIKQLAKSSTSIGANYEEAQGATSNRDFLAKISIAYKECKETHYWLVLIKKTEPSFKEAIKPLITECTELNKIIGSIVGKMRRKLNP